MTDLDLDRLGDIWRQQPDPAELAELKRAAEAVRRRARWSQLADAVAAVVVAGVVGLLAIRNASVDTLIIGGGAILILLISQVRNRKLRAAELRSLTGTTEQMLDQSIERVQATQKRTRLGLISSGPAVLLGILFARVVEDRSGYEVTAGIAAYPGLGKAILAAAAVAFVVMVVHGIRQLRSSRRELGRLTTLRDSYRSEREDAGE
jgi:hypothetical protein